MFHVVFTAFLLSSAVSSASAQPVPADGRREPILTVLGKGRYERKPERARFQAVVLTGGKTIDDAVKSHEERATRASEILSGLRNEGLELEKSSFKIEERRVERPLKPEDLNSGKRREWYTEGFDAKTAFSIKSVALERLNAGVNKMAESGLFTIEAIKFEVIQERAALNEARRSAMLDALEQARAYSEPVNLTLAQIIAVTDGEAEPPDGQADLPSRRAQGRYSIQILPPAVLEFTASVNVTWRIEPR